MLEAHIHLNSVNLKLLEYHVVAVLQCKKFREINALFVFNNSQVLDIAVVCAGHRTSRQVITLIKSILFYRRNPLHFHFISDPIAELILKTLFSSWKIPLGKCKVYIISISFLHISSHLASLASFHFLLMTSHEFAYFIKMAVQFVCFCLFLVNISFYPASRMMVGIGE